MMGLVFYIALLILTLVVYVLTTASGAGIILLILAVYGIVALLFVLLSGRNIDVGLLSDSEIKRGESGEVILRIKNNSRIPILRLEYEFKFRDKNTDDFKNYVKSEKHILSGFISNIPGQNGKRETRFDFSDEQCGKIEIEVGELRTCDPLGIFKRKVDGSDITEITVLPDLDIMDNPPEDEERFNMESYTFSNNKIGSDNSETVGIRDYVEGDSTKAIHWKLSAKTGDLMVREFGYPVENRYMITSESGLSDIPDDAQPDLVNRDNFDALHFSKMGGGKSTASELIAAIMLGLSSILVLVRMFNLEYGLTNMLSGDPVGGLIGLWNRIADVLGSTNYSILQKYVQGASSGYGLIITLFIIIAIAAAYLIIRSGYAFGLTIFAVPQIIFSIFYGLVAAPSIWLLFGTSLLFALIIAMGEGNSWPNSKINSKINSRLNNRFTGLIDNLVPGIVSAALVAAIILLLGGGTTKDMDERPGSIMEFGKEGLASISDSYYGTDAMGHGDLSARSRNVPSITAGGDIGDLNENATNNVALTVTMSEPQSIYLKGFIGSNFNGNSWTDISDAAYYQSKNIIDGLRGEGFYPYGELVQAAELAYGKSDITESSSTEGQITIENKNADSRIAYIPYELSDAGDLSNYQLKGGDEFYGGKFTKLKKYSYSIMENQTDNWTDLAARLFAVALYGNDSSNEERDATRDAVRTYLNKESYYNDFVYSHYTYISPANRTLLLKTIGSPGNQDDGHIGYKTAINTVINYLRDSYVYLDELGPKQNDGASEIQEFIESRKGYDVQFATLATLMFRYYGIPARYVEGYLITPDDADNMTAGEPFDIAIDRAHVWTEIYIDGVGFVPIEVSPEFQGIMNEADLSIGISNQELMNAFDEEFGGAPSLEEDDGEEEEIEIIRGGNNAARVLWILLIVLAVTVALTGLIYLIRVLWGIIAGAIFRKKLFYKSEPKKAISGIYDYMERLGLAIEDRARDLGNRAAYSKDSMTEDERHEMLDILKREKKSKGSNRRVGSGPTGKGRGLATTTSIFLILLVTIFVSSCTGNTPILDISDAETLGAVIEDTCKAIIADVPNPTVQAVGGDWAVIGILKSGLFSNHVEQSEYKKFFDIYLGNVRAELKKNQGKLTDSHYTEYMRLIIALTELNKLNDAGYNVDIKNIEGYDITTYIDDFDMVTGQGITAAAYALISSEVSRIELSNRDRYIEFIVDELESGGYYDRLDLTDYVSMSLQALALYGSENDDIIHNEMDNNEISNNQMDSRIGISDELQAKINSAIEKGVDSLSELQLGDGSLGNSEATTQCIMALVQLGIDPLNDERFIKDGNSLADGLMIYYVGDGRFAHLIGDEANQLATEEALLALDAIKIFDSGERLY